MYKSKEEILLLFKKLNVTYIEDYIYKVSGIDKISLKNSQYYIDNKDEFEYLAHKYFNDITGKSIADIYIDNTEKKGFGLFAKRNINKGSFIGLYLGVIQEEEEFVSYDESGYDTDYAWDYPDEIDGFPKMEINGKYFGNEMRFANHDSNNNLDVEHTVINNEWFIFFIANRDIKKDEELTIYYGDDYWSTEYRSLL